MEHLREHFFWLNLLLVGFLVFFLFRLWVKTEGPSKFRSWEADKRHARPEAVRRVSRETPLQLEGFRIDQEPHDILGVSKSASRREINRAYKKRMKLFHPDKIARPGTDAWHEAQKIAQRINEARTAMLEALNGDPDSSNSSD